MLERGHLAWIGVAVLVIGTAGTVGAFGLGALDAPSVGQAGEASDDPSSDYPEDQDDGDAVVFDGEEPLELVAGPNVTLDGTADLDDGTELQVRITSTAESGFLMSETVAVEDEAFAATFDLFDVEPTDVTVTVYLADGEEPDLLTSVDGVIVASDAADDRPIRDDSAGAVTFDDDPVELPAAPNATVSGTADAEPGAEIQVRVRSTGEQPFLVTDTTTVDGDGRFDAEVDLAEVEPDTTATVVARVVDDGTDGEPVDVFGNATVVEADWDVEDASGAPFEVDLGDEPVELEAANGTVVDGETDLDPDTRLTVRVRGTGDRPFLHTEAATVDDDGSFSVTYDLSYAEPGTDAEISVSADGDTAEPVDADVVDPDE